MSYNKRWRPNASQRREFAQRMQDPEERSAYEERKAAKKQQFYDIINELGHKSYVPTKEQHDFCIFNRPSNLTNEQEDACNFVCGAYACNEPVDHYYIHIVNELIRKQSQ